MRQIKIQFGHLMYLLSILLLHVALAVFLLWDIILGIRIFATAGDSIDQSFAWLNKSFTAIRQGEIVLWDFSTMGGVSFVGELQTSPLYPPVWIFGIFASANTFYAVDMFLVSHFILASLGMHVLGRNLGLGSIASFGAAAIFTYGSSFALRIGDQPNLFVSLAWLPWIVAAMKTSFSAPNAQIRKLSSIATGVTLALALTAGHVHSVVLSVIAGSTFGLFSIIEVPEPPITKARQIAFAGAIASLSALGLSLPQLLATREYLKLSYKWYGEGFTEYPHVVPFDIFLRGSLKLNDLSTLVTGKQVEALDGGTLYITITGLILCLVALISRRNFDGFSKPIWPSITLMIFSLSLAFPVIKPLGMLFYNIPIISLIRAPARALFLFAFAGSILAGIGIQTICQIFSERGPVLSRFKIGLIASVPLLVMAIFEIRTWHIPKIERSTSKENASLYAIREGALTRKLIELSNSGPLVYRFFANREDVPPNLGDVHPVLSAHGYRSSRPKAFHEYFDFNPNSKVADSLAIRWWVSEKELEDLPLIASIDGRMIYERPSAPPVFWQPGPGETKLDPGIARVEWGSNTVRVDFRNPIKGRLVFAQVQYPGFDATADNNTVIVGTYQGLMAIDLTQPTRVVEFTYRPGWLKWAISSVAVTVLGLTFFAIALIRKSSHLVTW
jgi:hypothetical protein